MSTRHDARFQRSLERLGELKDSCKGQACVIIGNGPSMKGFDLSRLEGVTTFCLNRGYLLWEEQGRRPDYLVSVNRLVIEQFSDQLQAVGTTLFTPWLMRHSFAADNDDVIFFEERWDDAFMKDARQGVASLATVTNTTLQIAWYMGFTTVVLIGVDHRFSASDKGNPHELIVQEGDDADHFHPDYFAPGTRWHLPDLIQSERGYSLAKQVYEADGRCIIDATAGGHLQIFEKRDLEEILPALRGNSSEKV